MTNVTCINDRGTYRIDIEGHADYAEGIDIVCSSVSTLGFTLMCALQNKESDMVKIHYTSGDIHVTVKPDKATKVHIDTIIETIMLGYAMLAEKYPDNVRLNWEC